jgi:hypothetical protein
VAPSRETTGTSHSPRRMRGCCTASSLGGDDAPGSRVHSRFPRQIHSSSKRERRRGRMTSCNGRRRWSSDSEGGCATTPQRRSSPARRSGRPRRHSSAEELTRRAPSRPLPLPRRPRQLAVGGAEQEGPGAPTARTLSC